MTTETNSPLQTNKFSDAAYNDILSNMSTKSFNYYTTNGPFNNNNNVLSVGYGAVTHQVPQIFPSFFEPTRSNELYDSHTLPHSTSADLGTARNNNNEFTTTGTILREGTGLLRSPNNQAELSEKTYNFFGDVYLEAINNTIQNAPVNELIGTRTYVSTRNRYKNECVLNKNN